MKSLVSLAVVVLLAGCSPGAGYADRSMTAEVLEQSVARNHDRVNAIFGSGTISVETPEIAQNVSFELSLQKPDSIMVRIEGPFGIDLGLAVVTRRDFLFYNSINNEVLTGPTNAENLSRVLRVKIEFDDMLNLFSGGMFFRDDRGRNADFSIVDDEYVLTFSHEGGARRYCIDPRSMQIVRIEHINAAGSVFLEQSFGRFLKTDTATVPQLVRVTLRNERRRLSVAYSDILVNPASLQFQFVIPPDAERTRIE